MWCRRVYAKSLVKVIPVLLDNRPLVSESRENSKFLIYSVQAVIEPVMTTYARMQIIIEAPATTRYIVSSWPKKKQHKYKDSWHKNLRFLKSDQ